jgi:hypothetical protein
MCPITRLQGIASFPATRWALGQSGRDRGSPNRLFFEEYPPPETPEQWKARMRIEESKLEALERDRDG